MSERKPFVSPGSRAFERKVGLSRCALFFEELWPRLWLVIGIVGLFILVSLAGLWPHLPDNAHKIGLGLFSVAFLGALTALFRVPWPTREAAVRRIERRSNVPHRPASSYEDSWTAACDGNTQRIWQEYKD